MFTIWRYSLYRILTIWRVDCSYIPQVQSFYYHIQQSQTSSKDGSKQCQKCGRFITMTSGWYGRHVKNCKGQMNNAKNDVTVAIKPTIQENNQMNKRVCYICQIGMPNLAKLKMHLINHYRNELRTKFDLAKFLPKCPFNTTCKYETSKMEHMLTHVGLTHSKIGEFLPPQQAAEIFPSSYQRAQPEANENNKRSYNDLSGISVPPGIYYIDPLGQTKVTAGRDHCFRKCCPYVRPHFSNLEKQNNRKQCSLLAWLWVWPSGSLMTPVLFLNIYFQQLNFISISYSYSRFFLK